ncbi:tetratricopeptide repeat protein [Salinimonas marina]|uniref:Tetratricopeptide repeat protein n=1 Tax=Salinimonas marina TaxID=2785918 RepID=A0A7S9DZ46_9ALTE|nr:tetratricopeptide repeat protein [Salinimonas marina]QPG06611.1 tetratricopeptide repeat protein [Salinimonas marina]
MRSQIKGCLLGLMLTGSSVAFADEAQTYDEALTAYTQGQYQDSYMLLKQVLNTNPDHLPSKLLMGRVLLLDGYVREAIDEFEEVLLAGGDENLVLPYLSRAYLYAGKFNKIFAMLSQYELDEDARLTVTLMAGNAHIRLNERQEAARLYQRTLNDFPHSVALLIAQTNLLIDLNQLEKAQQLLDRAIQLHGQAPFTLLASGKLADARGQQSLTHYEQAYLMAPDNPATMRAYAGALAEAGQYAKAEELVKAIERQSPNDVQNQLLKARLLALTQNQLEADKILRELTERLSLLSDEQLNEQIELSLIAGIVAYLNKNYEMASTELSRYLGQRDATPEQLGMLADSLLRTGSYKDAVKLLEKHEALVVQNLSLARLNCELFITLNRSFKCEQLLPELTRRYEGDPQFAILKTKLYMNIRKLDKAKALLNSQLRDSEDEEVIKLKIALLSDEENFSQALTLAQQLLTANEANPDYQALNADLLIRTSQLDQADELVGKLLNNNPQSVAGLVAKSRIAYYQKNLEQARLAIDEALKHDKTSVAARILAAQIYLADERNESAIEHLVSAKTLDKKDTLSRELLVKVYREEGDLKAALSEVNALLGLDRLSADYHIQKAAILYDMQDHKGAKTQLNMVYGLWANDAQKLVSLADLQYKSEDIAGAEKSYRAAIKLAPDSLLPYLELTSFLINQNQLSAAAQTIETIHQRFGASSNLVMLQGDLAVAKDNPQQGFALYLEALRADPNFGAPLFKAFELARKNIQRPAMMTYLQQAVKTHPGDTLKQHLLADLYYLNNDLSQATTLYQALLEMPELPRRAFVLNNLANIYAHTNSEQAMTLIEEALALAPRSAALLDTKGWILALNKDYQGGLGVLRQAYTLDASDPSVQYHIAYTLAQLERTEEAKALLSKHNTLSKQFREKPRAEALAATL